MEEDRLVEAQGEVPQNLILVFKSLGGGWQCDGDKPAPPPTEEASDESQPTVIPTPPPSTTEVKTDKTDIPGIK